MGQAWHGVGRLGNRPARKFKLAPLADRIVEITTASEIEKH